LARRVLPAVGARAPSTSSTRFDSWFVAGDEIGVVLDATTAPPALTDAGLLALDLASLTSVADDRLAQGELDEAMELYEESVAVSPGHFQAQFKLGRLHGALGYVERQRALY